MLDSRQRGSAANTLYSISTTRNKDREDAISKCIQAGYHQTCQNVSSELFRKTAVCLSLMHVVLHCLFQHFGTSCYLILHNLETANVPLLCNLCSNCICANLHGMQFLFFLHPRSLFHKLQAYFTDPSCNAKFAPCYSFLLPQQEGTKVLPSSPRLASFTGTREMRAAPDIHCLHMRKHSRYILHIIHQDT